MGPVGDAQGPAVVLFLDGGAYVDKLAVLEQEEAMAAGEVGEAGVGRGGLEAVDDVGVGFEGDDVGA